MADTAATRYFTPDTMLRCFVDDLSAVTTLKTDEDGDLTYETTWATTDYDLLPANAAGRGEPYQWVDVALNGRYGFPTHVNAVQIVGNFGYPSVPAPVTEACLILAQRIYKRKDAPFGIAGSTAFGDLQVLVKRDPDAYVLLEPYMKVGALGVGG